MGILKKCWSKGEERLLSNINTATIKYSDYFFPDGWDELEVRLFRLGNAKKMSLYMVNWSYSDKWVEGAYKRNKDIIENIILKDPSVAGEYAAGIIDPDKEKNGRWDKAEEVYGKGTIKYR